MHEMSLWAQAVGGSLRDLRRRRELGQRPDKFSAREPDYYEAHGYAPVGYSAKKARFAEPRNPGFPSGRKTAIAVVAIVIGATVPAFTIVSMLNPSDPETYHGAAGEYAAQKALDQVDPGALGDPAAAGVAADDLESYLDSEEYKKLLANQGGTEVAAPEVSTETNAQQSDVPAAPSLPIPATGAEATSPQLPEAPAAAAPSAVAPPANLPPAPAPSVAAPEAKPAAPQAKPKAPARTERERTPRVTVPAQPAKPARAEKPAKPQRSERAEQKKERAAKAPKTERGGKTLIDHGVEPKAPKAPDKSKAPTTPKAPKAPKTPSGPAQPQTPVAPDQPSVSVDPADPATNPAADDGGPVSTAPQAHTEPPSTDTARSQDDRRITPRSVKKEPSVTTETDDGPTGR